MCINFFGILVEKGGGVDQIQWFWGMFFRKYFENKGANKCPQKWTFKKGPKKILTQIIDAFSLEAPSEY